VGFEPTIPVSELTNTFHALDREASVMGAEIFNIRKLKGTRVVLPFLVQRFIGA
jgi:hypothetical protein